MTTAARGRRPGNPDTRSTILTAARAQFAAKGFSGASMRAIAGDAGVDASLLHHYFGTKADLYAASLELPISPDQVLAWSDVPPEQMGEVLARTFFGAWEVPEVRAIMLGILRGGMDGNEDAVRPFREFVTDMVQRRLAASMEGEDAEARALAMAAHLVGIEMVRHVVRVEPFPSMTVDELVDLVAPRLQSYFDG